MSKVYSLKCPNCAGALKLIGGGRVQTTTCPYCKSVIDLNDNYKVLYNFKNSVVPKVPFEIGMRGDIEGVKWTIIGWIVYRSEDDVNDKWSEFLLFSPFYGYIWLIYEEGEISLSRRIRDFNIQDWTQNSSSTFYKKGHYLLQEESYNSLVYFVQGELTWVAKKNDKTKYWDYQKTTKDSLNIEQSNNEIEVYHTTRLKAKEIYESFGVPKEKQIVKKRTFSQKIDEEVDGGKPLSFYGIILIAILLFGILFSSMTSDTLLSKRISSAGEYNFRVKTTAFLNKITINTSSTTTLNSYRFSLFKAKKKIFSIDKNSVYFSKKTLGKTWSRNSIGVKIFLKLDKGKYLLKVEKLNNIATTPISLKIEERIIKNLYFYPLFILVILFFVYFSFRKYNLLYQIGFVLIIAGLFGYPPLIFIGGILMFIAQFTKGSHND